MHTDTTTPTAPLRARDFDDLARRSEDTRVWGYLAIARELGISRPTLRRWHLDPARKLPLRRLGWRWYSTRGELRAWSQAQG